MPIDARWPGRPQLLPDESFSSWFARAAAANGLRPGDLYRVVQPGEDRNPRDLDLYADIHLIGRLADSTGIDPDVLGQGTFRHWAGKVFDQDDGAHKLGWLPPAGRSPFFAGSGAWLSSPPVPSTVACCSTAVATAANLSTSSARTHEGG